MPSKSFRQKLCRRSPWESARETSRTVSVRGEALGTGHVYGEAQAAPPPPSQDPQNIGFIFCFFWFLARTLQKTRENQNTKNNKTNILGSPGQPPPQNIFVDGFIVFVFTQIRIPTKTNIKQTNKQTTKQKQCHTLWGWHDHICYCFLFSIKPQYQTKTKRKPTKQTTQGHTLWWRRHDHVFVFLLFFGFNQS